MARIVFDLDGTLIDSAPDIQTGVNRMLEEEGIGPLDLKTVTSFLGNGLPHLVKLVISAVGLNMADHSRLCRATLAHYEAVSGRQSRPYDGVAEALDSLRSQGHLLGICTNKPEAPARDILDKLALGPFPIIIGGDSLPTRKPDPAPLHEVLHQMGSGPAIFIGDSEVDAETAKRAKIPFLLFSRGYRKTAVEDIRHEAAFSDFAELPELVSRT